MDKETKFIVLVAIFITFLTTAILTGSKIIVFLGITFSAGTLPYSLTYLITDTMCEVWGKTKTKQVVFSGLISMLVMFLLIYIAIVSPSASFWKLQTEYVELFGTSLRLIIAGIIAYIVSQLHDVWAFSIIKDKTKGKYLWLRNNISTVISQLLNTIIMVLIGFYGSIPQTAIFSTIFGWWIIKIIFAIFDTPFVYLLVKWVNYK